MQTCSDCRTNLDAVSRGEPCPNCGSQRRDVTVIVPTIRATASVPPASILITDEAQDLTVSMSVDAVIGNRAWRAVEDLAMAPTERRVMLHDPGEDGRVLCEVLDENGMLLAAETGADDQDAVLNVADVIARRSDADEA